MPWEIMMIRDITAQSYAIQLHSAFQFNSLLILTFV